MTTKVYKRVGLEDLDPALELLGLSERELSIKLGYAFGAVKGWRTQGHMPEVAKLALSALLSQSGATIEVENPSRFVIMEFPADAPPKILGWVTTLDEISLAGKKYFMVPKL